MRPCAELPVSIMEENGEGHDIPLVRDRSNPSNEATPVQDDAKTEARAQAGPETKEILDLKSGVINSEDEDAIELSYEEERQATIRANAELLASLGLQAEAIQPRAKPVVKRVPIKSANKAQPEKRSTRTTTPAQPARRSARIEKLETEHKSLPQDWDDRQIGSKRKRGDDREAAILPRGARVTIPSAVKYINEDEDADGPEIDEKKQPIPTRRDDGTGRLVFEGRWNGVFEPNLTPREVFAQGAFGGAYYA